MVSTINNYHYNRRQYICETTYTVMTIFSAIYKKALKISKSGRQRKHQHREICKAHL